VKTLSPATYIRPKAGGLVLLMRYGTAAVFVTSGCVELNGKERRELAAALLAGLKRKKVVRP